MLRDPSPDVDVDFAAIATASGQQCPDDAGQDTVWYSKCSRVFLSPQIDMGWIRVKACR